MAITAEEIAVSDRKTEELALDVARDLFDRLEGVGHAVPLRHGIRVTMLLWGGEVVEVVYVHAMPWSRGWSIFADDRPDCGAYDWRNVKAKYQGLSRPVYCPKGTSGAWRVDKSAIVDAIMSIVDRFVRLSNARRKRYNKQHWPVTLANAITRVMTTRSDNHA